MFVEMDNLSTKPPQRDDGLVAVLAILTNNTGIKTQDAVAIK